MGRPAIARLSGWPLHKDNVDIKQFVARLRQAADFMGYQLTPQEL